MTFVSLEFLALMALTLPLYYAIGQRARQVLLLVASYTFYAYWNPSYSALILVSTLIDYFAARVMVSSPSGSSGRRRLALVASLCGNLGLLFYFKYTDFAVDSLRSLLGPFGTAVPGPLELILPIGISFYTFQTLSYSVDVYRGEQKPERDFVVFALFVSFFPQLVAGPIERARDLLPQLQRRQPLRARNLELGMARILWGLLKKAVVSDRLAYAAFPSFLDPQAATSGELALSAATMFVVVYLDFSAYADLARGVAQLFGIRLSRNFDYPHAAGNVASYWRRWHMTLVTWIRDYVVRPLGETRGRGLLRRSGMALLVTGLIGLWHGAQWTFVVWGLANGVSIIGYYLLRRQALSRMPERWRRTAAWGLASWAASTFVRVLISVLFFAPSFGLAWTFYRRMLVTPSAAGGEDPRVLLGLLVLILFWTFHYVQSRIALGTLFGRLPPATRALGYALLIQIVLFFAVPFSQSFIYYQF